MDYAPTYGHAALNNSNDMAATSNMTHGTHGLAGLGALAALKIPGLSEGGDDSHSNANMIGTFTQNEILKDIGMQE